MKKIIYSVCTLTLALALTALGEDVTGTTKVKAKAKAGNTATVQSSARSSATVRSAGSVRAAGQFRTQQSASTPRISQRSYHVAPQVSANATVRENNRRNGPANPSDEIGPRKVEFHGRSDVAINRERSFNMNRERNATINPNRNVTSNGQSNVAVNRQRNVAINNNWRTAQFNGQNYAAFRNYHREWHDRFWWTSHYPRITFYFGAPYYWDAGYWYPAWGYYPDYVYQYDGPIYGYNGLAPDQVIVDVQVQLQRDGYYPGPIDGVLGQMTRRAIAAFQADHGLAITSTIDEPTLATLGLS